MDLELKRFKQQLLEVSDPKKHTEINDIGDIDSAMAYVENSVDLNVIEELQIRFAESMHSGNGANATGFTVDDTTRDQSSSGLDDLENALDSFIRYADRLNSTTAQIDMKNQVVHALSVDDVSEAYASELRLLSAKLSTSGSSGRPGLVRRRVELQSEISNSKEFTRLKGVYLESVLLTVQNPQQISVPIGNVNILLSNAKKLIDIVNFPGRFTTSP